jgi:hypothetical protein
MLQAGTIYIQGDAKISGDCVVPCRSLLCHTLQTDTVYIQGDAKILGNCVVPRRSFLYHTLQTGTIYIQGDAKITGDLRGAAPFIPMPYACWTVKRPRVG